MKHIIFPDYNHSLMNITTTILKNYNVPTPFASIEVLEQELKKSYRNVVLLLVDAMGSRILQKHQDVADYLIQNQIEELTTVFPSTTVSATTSVLTGQPPVSTGWIGWLQYIKEEDKSVIFFFNKDFYDESVEFSYNVSEKFVPVTKIYELIETSNQDVATAEIFPEFRVPEHKTIKDLCNTVVKETQKPGKHFIYAYWDKVDTYLHKYGTTSEEIHRHLAEVNQAIKDLVTDLDDDTLIIVTADHGQIDIEEVELWNYKDVVETFEHNPSVEARATAFFIKQGMEEQFEANFNKHFGEWFILYKSEDFLNAKYLGDSSEHQKLREFLGDYFSIAIDKYSFKLAHSKRAFKAQHAGMTVDEMMIPLILLNQKNKPR
ncbi:MAG: alkaline phosphatase family protein [Bacilli bacterium]|nr:alkaline phosphatase family protein [Bacilli bacterium]